MDILTIALSVLRRWYITVPVMLTAIAVAFYVNSTIPPQYEARGQILLASPDLDPSNLPRFFIDLGLLAGQLNTEAVASSLRVGDAEIDVSAETDSLSMVVSSNSPADAQATTDNVVDWLAEQVDQRQADQDFVEAERVRLQVSTQEIDSDEPGELGADPGDQAVVTEADGSVLATTITLDDPAARIPNPFGASNQTGRILTVAVQSDEGRMAVAQRAEPNVGFTLGQDGRDAAPILTITTFGADPDAVLEAFDHVADEVGATLSDREERAEVPPTRRTQIEPIAVPQSVTNVSPPLDRSVAAIIGLGGLLALALAIAVDGIQARRTGQIGSNTPAVRSSELTTSTAPDAERARMPDVDRNEAGDDGRPPERPRTRSTGVH